MAKLIKDFLESYDFNRAAIAKQRLANLRGAGRKVRGASIANLMRSARMEETELDEEDLDREGRAGLAITAMVHDQREAVKLKAETEINEWACCAVDKHRGLGNQKSVAH